MNLKIIAAIVVIVVVLGAIGVYAATRGPTVTNPNTTATPTIKPTTAPTANPSASTNPTSTATSTPTATASPTATPTSTSTPISSASSYEFNVSTANGNGVVIGTAYYAAKNLGTSNVDFIVVQTSSGSATEYIVNGAQQKAWVYSSGQWTDISSAYTSQESTVQQSAGLYVNMLKAYGGSGSFTYTAPNGAGSDTFTNVQINPSLPDSMFQPPS